jgi:hypothetical protein
LTLASGEIDHKISLRVYKESFHLILPALHNIINSSLATGVFPSLFKLAIVTPILKKSSDPKAFRSFRPVSNLSFASKCLETVVSEQLNKHVMAHGLHNHLQSAYKALHSTETALLHVSSEIYRHLDDGSSVFLVLLDLSAAFDTIDHRILLNRLKSDYNITGTALSWFQSYLSNRTFKVKLDSNLSTAHALKYGVPQGSVLGPILFSLYTAPLLRIFQHHGVSVHFYADDTQFWVPFNTKDPNGENKARFIISAVFTDIVAWMNDNHLKLNQDKTVFLPISRQKSHDQFAPIRLGNHSIPSVHHATNLGVIMSSNFSVDLQISKVVQAAFYHLRRLRYIRDRVPSSFFKILMHSFVTNRLDLLNSLYYNIPSKQIKRLQLVQSAAAKIVLHKRKFDSSSEALQQLHWLPVIRRVEFKVAVIAYKIFCNTAPEYLTAVIKKRSYERTTRSSHFSLLEYSCAHPRLKSCGERCFYFYCVHVWNKLPETIRACDTLSLFKAKLKTFLFKINQSVFF